MASIWCPKCGRVIGEFYSILDCDRYITAAKKKHRVCKDKPEHDQRGRVMMVDKEATK